MRITQLNDSQQLWNYDLRPNLDDGQSQLDIDSKLLHDLSTKYVLGLSKVTRQLPPSQHTQKIAGMLTDLSHELSIVFNSGILEQFSMSTAVAEYKKELGKKLVSDGNSITQMLRNIEKKIASKYSCSSQLLVSSFIENTNLTPYQYYREKAK